MIRQSAIAGRFYPSDAQILKADLDGFLKNTAPCEYRPKILIVPHAGYVYSGQTAAYAYACLKNLDVKKVAIFAPSHYVYFKGAAFSNADYFETPLGLIGVEKEITSKFQSGFTFMHSEPHRQEHAVEAQLPFLQNVLSDFEIIPIVYSECSGDEIKHMLEYFLSSDDTIAVISADLSHFKSYDDAVKIDTNTIECMQNLEPQNITQDATCGLSGVVGAIKYAKDHNLKQKTLNYKNSAEAFGDKSSVVGYVSAIFYGV